MMEDLVAADSEPRIVMIEATYLKAHRTAQRAGQNKAISAEAVLDILSDNQQGAFAKEDGEQVINADGQRLART